MNKFVFDSCSLIYLSKINKLSMLNLISDELFIDDAVYNESVISGKDQGYRDSFILDRFISDNVKVISQDISNEIDYFGAKGEASTFILGKDGLCVTSDSRAFKKILIRGGKVIKIEDLFYKNLKNRRITKNQFIQLIKELLDINAISAEKFYVLMEELNK